MTDSIPLELWVEEIVPKIPFPSLLTLVSTNRAFQQLLISAINWKAFFELYLSIHQKDELLREWARRLVALDHLPHI